jgi:L-alanine-DL-glutamate epimerase-like enolase superfamily enzyme
VQNTERSTEYMRPIFIGPLTLRAEIEHWPLVAPIRITGHTFTVVEILFVSLEHEGHEGRGEAAGVYYRKDDAIAMVNQIRGLSKSIEAGISRHALQQMLPPCGARNALDCALWDLEAKLRGCSAWQIADLAQPRPLLTTFTCGADEPEKMAEAARGYANARAIKLKLTGEPIDADRVSIVREARPDVWLGVDANQGFTPASMERLMPTLVKSRVALIEQPFPVGQESLLDGFQSPISIAADESAQNLSDIPGLVGRFNVVNIKLDKCGGLSEALLMARASRELGVETMVGNMFGSSLAMAPAFLVGQLCNVVDLDGPVFFKADRPNPVQYTEGYVMCPEPLWGSAHQGAQR